MGGVKPAHSPTKHAFEIKYLETGGNSWQRCLSGQGVVRPRWAEGKAQRLGWRRDNETCSVFEIKPIGE